MKTLALILAGGRGTRLDVLSNHRAKPSVPFGGKYRLIDFALSNCVNSEIYDIGVLTQYLPMSLHEHIGIGKPWDLDRKIGGVTLLHPYTGNNKTGGWYQGTAHAVYQNANFIKKHNPKYVIILSGDHVYNMNYDKMISYHKQQEAEVTIATKEVAWEETSQFGILNVNQEGQVIDFIEKPEKPISNLASMGVYVFNTDVLLEKLDLFSKKEDLDFGYHIIPNLINENYVSAYKHNGFWRDVGTLKSFWETNLDLTVPVPDMNLYNQDWKIHTRSKEKPPVKFGPQGEVNESLVSNGCIINGRVENSVLSPGVVVEEGALVRDSVIFSNTIIKKDAIVCQGIIDKNVVIGNNSHVGFGNDLTPNHKAPKKLQCGLNVIGKGAKIPSNTQIGRNCRIFSNVDRDDFADSVINSGNTVKSR
ncbi:glucose-1-phosphate adenylyltransferase [Halanaerocella petrolearia]